jgi:hypothetical protein
MFLDAERLSEREGNGMIHFEAFQNITVEPDSA